MKKIIYVFVFFSLMFINAFGKGQANQLTIGENIKPDDVPVNGIYKDNADWLSNTVTNAIKSNLLNHIFVDLDNNLVLVRKGDKQKIDFGNVAGYYQDGVRYRAYGSKGFFSLHGYYKVVDDTGLIIYTRRSKNHKTGGRTWYYYSVAPDSPIQKIKPSNLKKDFAGRPEFVAQSIKAYRNGTLFVKIPNGELRINELYNSVNN